LLQLEKFRECLRVRASPFSFLRFRRRSRGRRRRRRRRKKRRRRRRRKIFQVQ
jgi:hypothetical protein